HRGHPRRAAVPHRSDGRLGAGDGDGGAELVTGAPAGDAYDVVVAGAGPAGGSTAIALLGRAPGLRGRGVDRARFPRAPPGGGGPTGHATEAMAALGVAVDVPATPAPRARVTFGDFARDVALPRPVNVVRREEFDAALVAAARAAGAEVREGVGVTGLDADAGGGRRGAGRHCEPA